jgi:hypothetical protein
MASKVSREAIDMLRAILGEGPSEAELIRCLYMARSDVALAINHYMDSANTSYGRVPPPRRTSGPPPADPVKTSPSQSAAPSTAFPLQEENGGADAQGKRDSCPGNPGRDTEDDYIGSEGLGNTAVQKSEEELEPQSLELPTVGQSDGLALQQSGRSPEAAHESKFGEPLEVRNPVVEISQHRPRLPTRVAQDLGGDVRTPIDVAADSDLPAPFLKRAKKQRQGTSEDWWLLRETQVVGFSTTKGQKLRTDEDVSFSFPKQGGGKGEKKKLPFRGGKPTGQNLEIVRFSTTRAGEVGRLPGDFAKCLIPLVAEKKVKLEGVCIRAPETLTMMCNVDLAVR